MEYQDIKDWMLNHPIESKIIIASLLENDKILIGDLVTLKEMAMRNRIDSMKESLPEPHYHPFENAEEVMEAIKEHGDWVRYEGEYYRIVAVTRAMVYYGGVEDGESFCKAVANTFTDGTPFGKLVEE